MFDGFTRQHSIKRLVWFEQHATMEHAIVREKRIKKWLRRWKMELIERDNLGWRDLAEDWGFAPLEPTGSRFRGDDESWSLILSNSNMEDRLAGANGVENKIPTHDDIMDDGGLEPEPSANYRENLDMLDNVTRECISISRAHGGIPSPTSRHFYGSVLFTLMITKCVSLLMLSPHTPWASKRIEHWDYSSMTGIARTILELRIAFYYLCVEACPEDEWQVRWNLFNLHDCVSRIRMFDALGDSEQVSGFEAQAEELRERLRSNSFFQSLDPKLHKKLLHGQKAYLDSLEAIAERAGVDVENFRFLYVLLSSHVHALPMSFYRIGVDNQDRGRGLPSPQEEGYSALCLSISATMLVTSRDEFKELFADFRQESAPSSQPADETEPPEMAIGESHMLDASDEIALRVERTASDTLTTSYVYRPTDDVVLERADYEEGGVDLLSFDPIYWTFVLNGGPVTSSMLERALAQPHAHRIDVGERRILLKTANPDGG